MMSEIRKDPFSGSLVIYSPGRENRPDFTGIKKSIELSPENCPFCRGNEEMTPPEIYCVRDDSGWRVRVIPNKFPVLKVEEERRAEDKGIFGKFQAAGAHEVIVETPSHLVNLAEMDAGHFRDIFFVYRERLRDLKKDFRLKYIQIFKNYGAAAGATISHHHSQLIALPFVPENIIERLNALKEYYRINSRSLFSDVISGELENRERVICENEAFLGFAPWYSRSPFQISIFPKGETSGFENISDANLKNLSEIFACVMRKLVKALGDPSVNIILNNAPFQPMPDLSFRWTLEILPVLGGTGGFEAATGTYINSVLPEKASSILREL